MELTNLDHDELQEQGQRIIFESLGGQYWRLRWEWILNLLEPGYLLLSEHIGLGPGTDKYRGIHDGLFLKTLIFSGGGMMVHASMTGKQIFASIAAWQQTHEKSARERDNCEPKAGCRERGIGRLYSRLSQTAFPTVSSTATSGAISLRYGPKRPTLLTVVKV